MNRKFPELNPEWLVEAPYFVLSETENRTKDDTSYKIRGPHCSEITTLIFKRIKTFLLNFIKV